LLNAGRLARDSGRLKWKICDVTCKASINWFSSAHAAS
jgi:hypothetical protein